MKKSKLSSLAVAAIATVAVTAGLAFAWFVTTEQASGIDVTAGTIEMDVAWPSAINGGNKLPGESIDVGNTSIRNTGTREAILRVNVADSFRGFITNRGVEIGKVAYDRGVTTQDLVATFNTSTRTDYVAVPNPGTAQADRVFEIQKDRLAEIASASFDEGGATGWLKCSDGNYYARLDPQNTITISNLKIELSGELGGLVGQNAAETPSRQFEQYSQFELNYTIKAVQATQAAVADEFGPIVSEFPTAWFN